MSKGKFFSVLFLSLFFCYFCFEFDKFKDDKLDVFEVFFVDCCFDFFCCIYLYFVVLFKFYGSWCNGVIWSCLFEK